MDSDSWRLINSVLRGVLIYMNIYRSMILCVRVLRTCGMHILLENWGKLLVFLVLLVKSVEGLDQGQPLIYNSLGWVLSIWKY